MDSKTSAKIPIVIIVTPGQNRHIPLVEALRNSSIFRVQELAATMGSDLEGPFEKASERELIQYGRALTANERACAISHLRARYIIADSQLGGVILEDDARVINLTVLETSVANFLNKSQGKCKILSLVDYRDSHKNHQRRLIKKLLPTFRLFAECPLAVAVALTPHAARNLIESAQFSSQVSDWPESNCQFSCLASGNFRHGDTNTTSIIGDIAERKVTNIGNLSLGRRWRRLLQKIDSLMIMWVQK